MSGIGRVAHVTKGVERVPNPRMTLSKENVVQHKEALDREVAVGVDRRGTLFKRRSLHAADLLFCKVGGRLE